MKKYELPDDFYKLSNEQLNAEIRKLKEVNRSRIRRLASRPTLSRYTQNFIPKINLAKATREEKEHVAKQLIAQLNAPESSITGAKELERIEFAASSEARAGIVAGSNLSVDRYWGIYKKLKDADPSLYNAFAANTSSEFYHIFQAVVDKWLSENAEDLSELSDEEIVASILPDLRTAYEDDAE